MNKDLLKVTYIEYLYEWYEYYNNNYEHAITFDEFCNCEILINKYKDTAINKMRLAKIEKIWM